MDPVSFAHERSWVRPFMALEYENLRCALLIRTFNANA